MNAFWLDYNNDIAAQYYVDKHVVKIITEINQCLSTAYKEGEAPYKLTHVNHPLCIFARSSLSNFRYLIDHNLALCKEYTYRYEKQHKGEQILNWFINNPPKIKDIGLQSIPRCFSDFTDIINDEDIVDAYRKYYLLSKRHLFKWKNRPTPYWIN